MALKIFYHTSVISSPGTGKSEEFPIITSMKRCSTLLILAFLLSGKQGVYGQIPQTDLYIFQLTRDALGKWHIHNPLFLSHWNSGGYTNQPEWIDAHRLLVSARLASDDQNDIYMLDLTNASLRRMTATAESEFSPLVTPGRQHFSVIRQVHGSDEIDQRIYEIPIDLSSAGRPLFLSITNVGYHCWMSDDELALFLVDEPAKLALANISSATSRIFASQIGRCMHMTPDGQLAYVHKYADTHWFLKTLDPDVRRSSIVVQMPEGVEDFAIAEDDIYFSGQGSRFLTFDPGQADAGWQLVFDLAVYGVQNITRMAVYGNRIAIVDQKD